MSVSILLLRGINVGGRNRLPMDELKALARACGANAAAHYLQSGNLAVSGPVDPDNLSDAIAKARGFAPRILSRSLDQWRGIVAANPFPGVADHKALHLFCLAGPSAATTSELQAEAGETERVAVRGTEVYLHTPGYLRGSRIAERMDRLLGVQTTARNWRSVAAILKLGEELAAP